MPEIKYNSSMEEVQLEIDKSRAIVNAGIISPKFKNISEYIICAAIWYDDKIKREYLPRNIKTGIVSSGWRHGNCITILKSIFLNREYLNNRKLTIQGFLTSKGNFVNRKEAAEIAFKANQIEKETITLFSEDIY